MMGLAQWTADVPVLKGTSGILVLRADQVEELLYGACIRCGSCIRACPMGLVPSLLGQLGEGRRVDEAARHDLLDCVECGCCTYVCPSHRPMVHWVKWLKRELARKQQREKEAELAAKNKTEEAEVADKENC